MKIFGGAIAAVFALIMVGTLLPGMRDPTWRIGDPDNCLGQVLFERDVYEVRPRMRALPGDPHQSAVETVIAAARIAGTPFCSGVDRGRPPMPGPRR